MYSESDDTMKSVQMRLLMALPVCFFLKRKPMAAMLYEVRGWRGIAYESFLRLLLLLLLGAFRNIPYGKLSLQVRFRRMISYIVGEGRATISPFERSEKHEKKRFPFRGTSFFYILL